MMVWRFTLSHETLGTLQINEPDGWRQAKMRLERHKTFHSLIEYFDSSFVFYGKTLSGDGGADFIKAVELIGIDEYLEILVEVSYDGANFEEAFLGQLPLDEIEEVNDNKVRVPIIRDDFWSKFINRLDTPVDLQSMIDLDGNPVSLYYPINVHLTNQTLPKRYYGIFKLGALMQQAAANAYYQFTPDLNEIEEVENVYSLPNYSTIEVPVWWFDAAEEGAYEFDLQVVLSGYQGAGSSPTPPPEDAGYDSLIDGLGNYLVDVYIQKNDETPVKFSGVNGSNPTSGTFWDYTIYNILISMSLSVGDTIRVYAKDNTNFRTAYALWGKDGSYYRLSDPLPIANITGIEIPSYFKINAQTRYPETNSTGFLIHDAASLITDRIIGGDKTLYSIAMGSNLTETRQYASNGCYWPAALVRGLQIRQYSISDKPFQMSFNQWWKGADPIFNLGLSYDFIGGQQVIRIEDRGYFYDDSSISVLFDNVRGDDLTRSHDQDMIFNKIEVGYSKWQAEEISGIDDPQTKHVYASRLKRTGKPLNLHSDFIAASQVIEFTRRRTIQKSSDYKFDNDTFFISVNPVPSGDLFPVPAVYKTFLPERDEFMDSVTNIANPSQRYNLRFTPARNFLRHLRYASAALQSYLMSLFTFQSGEGNYDMASTIKVSHCDPAKYGGVELSEKQGIPVSGIPTKLDDYQKGIKIPMSMSEYNTILANRNVCIGISQSTMNHKRLLIDILDYQPVLGICTISGWWRDRFQMSNAGAVSQPICYGKFDAPCGDDSLLWEDGDFMLTEDGECLIIE